VAVYLVGLLCLTALNHNCCVCRCVLQGALWRAGLPEWPAIGALIWLPLSCCCFPAVFDCCVWLALLTVLCAAGSAVAARAA
jgi:hypothetical protein